jgi:NADPH-dependent curcumin reductase CurA
MQSRQWHLARRPNGWPTDDDVSLVDVDLPEPADGELLVVNHYLSVDPYMRGRMNAVRSYAPPYELGQPMYGGAVGQVVQSRSPTVQERALSSCTTLAGAPPLWSPPARPNQSTRIRPTCPPTSACSACPG